MMKNIINGFLACCIVLFGGCDETLVTEKIVENAPVISDFTPKTGPIGTLITITGENLEKVDKATLGGEPIAIYNRISSSEMIVIVSATAKSGSVGLSNSIGSSQSDATFTITYPQPVIKEHPAMAKVSSKVVISGENLDVVQKVMFGAVEATIVSKNSRELIVIVPYFTQTDVAISLSYYNGSESVEVSTPEHAFTMDRVIPTVTSAPSSGEVSKTITITGTNLDVVADAYFGQYKATISAQTATSLDVTIPSDFTVSEEVVFKLIYEETLGVVVNSNFAVIVPAPTLIYYWENVTLYCQDPTTTDNFFNPNSGEIYTPCEYATKKNDIYFFFTISSTLLQLNNPNNSPNQTKNFKCSGTALPTEVMPNIVKFRVLKTTDPAENDFIVKVKAKQLTSISQQDIADAGIANGTASTPRFNDPAGYIVGDVIMFQYFSDASTVSKVGFIEITGANFLTGTEVNKSNVTFNCYYQK